MHGGFMNTARRVVFLVLAGWLAACASGPVVGRDWELLGRREVDFQVDHDVLQVGRIQGRFHELRFVVQGGAIEMYDVRVVLGDGDTFRPATRFVFDEGEGRTLELPGDRRVVRRVEFVYRSLRAAGRRAIVSLYGR
jgi:hypothetical protein